MDTSTHHCLETIRVDQQTIEVIETAQLRQLRINNIPQSTLDLTHPQQLEPGPMQAMVLCHLLQTTSPKKITIFGLGGGSLVRFHQQLVPQAVIHCYEKHPCIVSIAKKHFGISAQANLLIHCCDALEAIKQDQPAPKESDLIFLDFAEDAHSPAQFFDEHFQRQCQHNLSNTGMLILNVLVKSAESLRELLALLRSLYKQQLLCLDLPNHKNIILYAFNGKPTCVNKQELSTQYRHFAQRHQLNLSNPIERLFEINPHQAEQFTFS